MSQQEPRLRADEIFAPSRIHLCLRARHVGMRAEDAAISFDRLHHSAAPFALIEVLEYALVHSLTFVMPAHRTCYCGHELKHQSPRTTNALKIMSIDLFVKKKVKFKYS